MKFSEIINCEKSQDFEISGVCSDTRKIAVGDIFFALDGSKENGEKYIENALKLGAKCVICENIDKKTTYSGFSTGAKPKNDDTYAPCSIRPSLYFWAVPVFPPML